VPDADPGGVPRTRRHPVLLAAPLALALLIAVAFTALTSAQAERAFGDARSATARAASVPSDQVFPVAGADFQRAIAVAQGFWGATPCNGQVTYTWSGLEPLTNARASWSNPSSAWGNAAQNFACEVVFNRGMQFDFPMLCTVMTHEIGHLLGQQHDPNAGQLMSAIYTAPIGPCQAGQPPAPVAQPAAAAAPEGEQVAWNVSDEREAEPKKRKTKKRTKKGKRKCVSRYSKAKGKKVKRCYRSTRRCRTTFRAGKRVKRCVTVRTRVAAPKRRTLRKARAAAVRHSA
jgi:hypothetical protein